MVSKDLMIIKLDTVPNQRNKSVKGVTLIKGGPK